MPYLERTKEYKDARFNEFKIILDRKKLKILSGKYTTNKGKFLVQCEICNYEFETTPNRMKNGLSGCSRCAGIEKKSLDEFKKTLVKDYKYISGDYINSSSKILIKHIPCNTEFYTTWNEWNGQGNRCKKCGYPKRLTNVRKIAYIDFVKRIFDLGFITISKFNEYKDKKTKLLVRHIECGNNMKINRDMLLNGTPLRCKHCRPSGRASAGQSEVYDFMKSIYDGNIISDSVELLGNNTEVDMYLPELNLAFEYNGLYWHSEKFKSNDYHYKKYNDCKEKNVQLYTIYESEWIHKKEIVKDKIRYMLDNKSLTKIFARKCYIKEIEDSKTVTNFLQKNHIQGKTSKVALSLGLYQKKDDSLVGMMTFGYGIANRGSDSLELTRYATLLNHSVIGGFTKVISYLKNTFEVPDNKIYSYADLRHSDGNLYESNGWIKESLVKSTYAYTDGSKVFHKSLYTKEKIKIKFPKIYSELLTEKEMMMKTNLSRIYDAGKIKYVLEL